MNASRDIWKTKTLARTHDPAEKALVLMRDPAGHEGGSVAKLNSTLLNGESVPDDIVGIIRKADRWAAAADRPQFPKPDGKADAWWSQVNFAKEPILYHPLSGDMLDLIKLEDIEVEEIKVVILDHFTRLVKKDADSRTDWKRTCLSIWRHGPESPHGHLGAFWRYLPADTRIPDHTIWDHLDLASAFAGAFAGDPEGVPALLTMSIGPVQSFISQARSVSDLWAASHLLSMTTWAAMKVLCEKIGPDSIIFPQLRGVPVVDLWLDKEMGVAPPDHPDGHQPKRVSDADPLFRAALPNKFMAIVPASEASNLASAATEAARTWIREHAETAASSLLKTVGEEIDLSAYLFSQIKNQLDCFPEVHWSSVPWSLIKQDNKGIAASTQELSEALRPFYPAGIQAGFLGSDVWRLISSRGVFCDKFFPPNPGILYPSIYDLGDRVFNSAKSVRPFNQHTQTGFRCSMCGEREWLTLKEEDLSLSPGERKGTLWDRVSQKRLAWAKKGEYLCALCALKRLWPSLFVDEIRRYYQTDADRYVVSTHTMALATTMGRLLDQGGGAVEETSAFQKLHTMISESGVPRTALPLSLHRKLQRAPEKVRFLLERLPAYLDERREEIRALDREQGAQAQKLLRCVEDIIGNLAAGRSDKKKINGRPEAYYALIMGDGDNMGAWISGSDPRFSISYGSTWHPRLRNALSANGPEGWFTPVLEMKRPTSPGKHAAISSALNIFALELCGMVVEEFFKGKLIYAGGDDLLAMVSVDDLLPCLLMLRLVYSGEGIDARHALSTSFEELGVEEAPPIKARRGHIKIRKRLSRVMGLKATASFGAVVAHHTAPLAGVLRELRSAERRAKESGRDSFSISIIKRAGGKTTLTLPWGLPSPDGQEGKSPMEVLIELRNLFGRTGMSRRAAYLIQQWAEGVPEPGLLGGIEPFKALLTANLEYQLKRQYSQLKSGAREESRDRKARLCKAVAADITNLVAAESSKGRQARRLLKDIVTVAEFLGREGRFIPFEDKEE